MNRELRLLRMRPELESKVRARYADKALLEEQLRQLYLDCCAHYEHYQDAMYELGRLLLIIQVVIQVRHDRDFVAYVEETLGIPSSSAYEYRAYYLRVSAEGADFGASRQSSTLPG